MLSLIQVVNLLTSVYSTGLEDVPQWNPLENTPTSLYWSGERDEAHANGEPASRGLYSETIHNCFDYTLGDHKPRAVSMVVCYVNQKLTKQASALNLPLAQTSLLCSIFRSFLSSVFWATVKFVSCASQPVAYSMCCSASCKIPSVSWAAEIHNKYFENDTNSNSFDF